MLENWTPEQYHAVHEYLTLCIEKSNKCSHCLLKHQDGTCFFAYGCFLNNNSFYREDKKSSL